MSSHPTRSAILALIPLLSATAPATAQRQAAILGGTGPCPERAATAAEQRPARPDTALYDVVLSVPNLCVDRLELVVRGLVAHVALDAQVGNLVQLTAGADARIDAVDLRLHGVEAEVLLLVDLDNVVYVVDRAMDLIDSNPEVLTSTLQTVGRTVGTVGGVAQTALQPGGVVSQTVGALDRTLQNVTAPDGLLSQTVNTLGQPVQRVVDGTGRILERTVDDAGQVVGSRTVGNALDLPVVRETTGAGGQVIRQVRDASGRLIELALDAAGRVTTARVLEGGQR